jgi:hypothetical protein
VLPTAVAQELQVQPTNLNVKAQKLFIVLGLKPNHLQGETYTVKTLLEQAAQLPLEIQNLDVNEDDGLLRSPPKEGEGPWTEELWKLIDVIRRLKGDQCWLPDFSHIFRVPRGLRTPVHDPATSQNPRTGRQPLRSLSPNTVLQRDNDRSHIETVAEVHESNYVSPENRKVWVQVFQLMCILLLITMALKVYLLSSILRLGMHLVTGFKIN